jgi:hypothetical protein
VVRFVHSDYKGAATADEFAQFFPAARDIAVEGMSLRSIFLSIAKAGRIHDASVVSSPGRAKGEKE